MIAADYSRYRLSRVQWLSAAVIGCFACFAAAWLICRQPAVSAAAAAAGLAYPRIRRARLLRRRKNTLRLHFNEMLQVLSSMLSAGRSVENAFLSLESDLVLILADVRSDLLTELRSLAARIRNGEALEPVLSDFARRSDLEEIRNFAEAFAVAKRAGGDLPEIVRSTSRLIGERLEVELELSVLMSQKRFESRIMMVMPFAFLGFLGMFARDYMAPLREGAGWGLLAVCMALLAACCRWMAKIMDIEV